jgi:hypothetical protein
MATNKFRATIRFKEELYDQLQSIAEKEKRSINNLVEYIVEQWVDEYQSPNEHKQTDQ